MTLSEYASRFIGNAYEWPGFSWCEVYVQAWMEYYGMTEKKTFNTKTGNGSLQYANGHYFYGGHEFPADDWDMEVIFTKKVKPVQVDSVVRHRTWPTWLDSGEPIYFVVKAIVADKAWIAYKDQKREDMLTSLDRLYLDE
jgi:hypothetical protein